MTMRVYSKIICDRESHLHSLRNILADYHQKGEVFMVKIAVKIGIAIVGVEN